MNIPFNVKLLMEAIELHPDQPEVYIVGGAVRDHLLGEEPKDYDLTSSLTPEELVKWLSRTINYSVVEGNNSQAFGTCFVKTNGGIVEVTTFRKDLTVGRHPKVEYTKILEEDAIRRDFTVNSLYMDLNGAIKDPTGFGFADVSNKVIRFTSDAHKLINQDPLRVLRAMRLACKNFTWSLEAHLAVHDTDFVIPLVKTLSMERVRDEIVKMVYLSPARAFLNLNESGLMDIFLPEVKKCYRYDQNTPFHKYTLDKHQNMVADFLIVTKADPELVFIGWLHDIGKPLSREDNKHGYSSYIEHDEVGASMIAVIFDRFKFSKKSSKRAFLLVRYHMKLHQQHKLKSLLKLRDTMGEFHLDIVKLYKADLYGSRGQTSYMNDELPQIINTYTSDQAMNALREIIGYGYDKRYIGEVLERVKEFYYDFPNIPMRTLESRVKDFIRSKY